MNTAFSPIRLCTVSGIQVPSFWPEALNATARSTRALTVHNLMGEKAVFMLTRKWAH